MAELKLGYKASAEQFAPRELVELAVLAEAHGMDSATVSDHFQPWRHDGGHAPFSLSWMTAVGERTQRIVLGTSVLTPTFRYNPAVIAQAFATMGCLYPGRVFLGVGTGEALNEIATGYIGTWPDFKERFARLRESVRLMRELWRGDRVDFDGDYYKLRGRRSTTSRTAEYPFTSRPAAPSSRNTPGGRATDSSAPQAGRRTLRRPADPGGPRGAAAAGRLRRRHRQDDRDQNLLRPESRTGAEQPPVRTAVADARTEAQRVDPMEMERSGRRAAD